MVLFVKYIRQMRLFLSIKLSQINIKIHNGNKLVKFPFGEFGRTNKNVGSICYLWGRRDQT